jgi:uncharacterized protein YybS (DUF2232 family)
MPPQAPMQFYRERFALSSTVTLGAIMGTFIPYIMYFTPVPLAVMVVRHGLRSGISTAFFTSLLVGVATQTPLSMLMVLLILGLGVVFGEALRNGFTLRQTLMVGWLAMMVAQMMPYYVAPNLMGTDIMGEILTYWEENLHKAVWWMDGQTIDPEKTAMLLQQIRIIFPAMIALSAAALTLANYWFTGRWLKRLGVNVPATPPFSHWRFPWYFAWVYIIGVALTLLPGDLMSPLLRVAANLQVIAGVIFFVQGLALAWFFFNKLRIRRFLKVALIALGLILITYLFQPLVLLGLMDTWFDFRRLKYTRPPA